MCAIFVYYHVVTLRVTVWVMHQIWHLCKIYECMDDVFLMIVQLSLSLITYGDEHSTRTRSISRRKSLPNSIYRIFFSFYTHAHACNRLSIFLLFSPSPVLSRSHGTHRSGTMVALYSTAALAEFGLAPAKRYSRCSRHVEFIVADRSINRFWPLFPVMVACEAFKRVALKVPRVIHRGDVRGFPAAWWDFFIFFDFNMFMKKYNKLFF